MPGTGGAAETVVVLMVAQPGVNYEFAVGKFRLVHTTWLHITT